LNDSVMARNRPVPQHDVVVVTAPYRRYPAGLQAKPRPIPTDQRRHCF